MTRIEVGATTVDYEVLGPAESNHPPVVFIHGILVDRRLWSPAAERLAGRGYRCYLPTLPLGSHTVAAPDADLSPVGMADVIGGLLAAWQLHEVTLVGNDTGGGLCQILVDRRPDLVGRLLLTNCDAFEAFPPFPFNLVFATLRTPRSIAAMFALMRLRILRHSPLGFGLLTRPDAALTESWTMPCRTDAAIRGDLARMLGNVAGFDLCDTATRLPAFDKPVSVLWGQADRAFTPALGRRLAAVFPDATYAEVPGARTFVSRDAPDAVVEAVEALDARRPR